MDAPRLVDLLDKHRPALARWVQRHASGLLAFEQVDDLVQGIHAHAIEVQDRFEWRGERAFHGWLTAIARQHVADRAAWFTAKKREAGALLRVTADFTKTSGASKRTRGVTPASGTRGPSTRAEQDESLAIAMSALDVLMPRDRELVKWFSEDVALDEVARRLSISEDAAERARLRAVERFRRAYALVEKRRASRGV